MKIQNPKGVVRKPLSKKNRKKGGKRLNAGRKPLAYKTKQLRMYVREELHDKLMEFLKEKVKEFELNT
jgi:hypothetical protein